MPTPRLVQITAWSYSRYETYAQCPFKAKCKVIDKLPEPDSSAAREGTRVHVLAAAFTLGRMPDLDRQTEEYRGQLTAALKPRAPFPNELSTFTEEFRALKRAKARVEEQWAFNKDWQPTGWFDRDAWLRIKVDCHYLEAAKKNGGLRETTVHIIDHKTGKENPDHALQRSLYALGSFLQYPDAQRVVASHWYLGPGKIGGPDQWERSQLEDLKADWMARITALLNDSTFAPRPGDYCRWCAFSKAKKGPCPY